LLPRPVEGDLVAYCLELVECEVPCAIGVETGEEVCTGSS